MFHATVAHMDGHHQYLGVYPTRDEAQRVAEMRRDDPASATLIVPVPAGWYVMVTRNGRQDIYSQHETRVDAMAAAGSADIMLDVEVVYVPPAGTTTTRHNAPALWDMLNPGR